MTGFADSLLTALVLIAVGVGTAVAVEPPAAPQPRYAVHAGLERAATVDDASGRYRLDSRLAPEPQQPKRAGTLQLQAKLVDATATACAVTDLIFANGFE